jgi:hypothetical protein
VGFDDVKEKAYCADKKKEGSDAVETMVHDG